MKTAVLSSVILCAVLSAHAMASDMGAIGAYVVKTSVDSGGIKDGTGFGVNGWYGFGGPFVHGEYQSVSLNTDTDTDVDVNSLRLGGGFGMDLTRQAFLFGKIEYVDLGSDFNISGFGIHGGLRFEATPQVAFRGSIGTLQMKDDDIDESVDGLEISVDASFKFTRDFGGFLGYRTWSGSSDLYDLDINDLRAGIFLALGR